jgi:NAD-dependent DNA ligase
MPKLADYQDYSRFTDKQETDKAFHTLDGILNGINIDHNINKTEVEELKKWCADHYHYVKRPPFNEVISLILQITDDGIITDEEYADLSWVCKNIYSPNKYFNAVTSDIQRLQGILHGILADGVITADELTGLLDWINEHPDMSNSYPYDEIETLLYKVLEDKIVDDEEQKLLKVYFSQFVDIKNTSVDEAELEEFLKTMRLPLICTMSPNLQFEGRLFCFTGISARYKKRQEIAEKITMLGGIYNNNITKQTEYLIVGDKNNPSWAFSCYGRKVESAIEYRKTGSGIQIVKEVDFWDEADSRLRV